MDMMMNMNPAGMENLTIRCRNKTNWFRIVVLTLVTALASWLGFGLFCTLLESSLSFWQALVTPLALIFLVIDLVTVFISNKNKNTDRP